MAETFLNSAEATHQQIVHPAHVGATEEDRREEAKEHLSYRYIRLSNSALLCSPSSAASPHVPYGRVAGRAPSGIAAYSNGSDTHFSNEKAYWKRVRDGVGSSSCSSPSPSTPAPPLSSATAACADSDSTSGGRNKDNSEDMNNLLRFYTGYKWQCVEFARRWLLQHRGVLLPDVQIAAHIIYLETMLHAPTAREIKVKPVFNGTFIPPTAGSLIIYPQSNENFVGHVGVIVEATETYVRVADQNRFFHHWGDDHYSAEYAVERDAKGRYWIRDDVIEPVGWVTFPTAPNYVVDYTALVPEAVEYSEHNGVLYAGINPPVTIIGGEKVRDDSPTEGDDKLLVEVDCSWLSGLSFPDDVSGGMNLGVCTYLKYWGRSMAGFKGKALFVATLGRILAFVSWRALTDWARKSPKVEDSHIYHADNAT